MKKKMFSLFLVFVMIMSLIPIVEIKDSNASVGVGINKKAVTLFMNQKYQLKLSGTELKSVTSSNKKVVMVNSKGLIKGIKAGKATVSLKGSNNKIYKCSVTVKNPYISKTSISLIKGKSYTLKLYGTSVKSVSTSNKKVATISKNGVVKSVEKGSCYVNLVGNNKKTYKCKVTVKIPSLSMTNLSMIKGNTFTLKINNTSSKVIWSTSDKSIATVNNKGLVKGVDLGNAIIYAKVDGFTLKCNIEVKDKGLSSSQIIMTEGKSAILKTIGFKAKSYITNNNGIATIDDNGKITAGYEGNTIIKVISEDDEVFICNIIVENPKLMYWETNKREGCQEKIYLQNTIRTAKWSVSDTTLAKITQNGIVSFLKPGNVCVYVKLSDITLKYSFKINKSEDNRIYKHKHTFDDGKILVEPTCSHFGNIRYTCKTCGYHYALAGALPPLEHKMYLREKREATCIEGGYDLYLCKNCSMEEKRNITPKIDHKWIKVNEFYSYCEICGVGK